MNELAGGPGTPEEGRVSKCNRTTAEERELWAKLFTESGLSLRKFSAQHGLHWYTLWRWVDRRRQLARQNGAELDGGSFEFTEIKLPDSRWVAELSLPGGKILRLSKDISEAMLEKLLRVC